MLPFFHLNTRNLLLIPRVNTRVKKPSPIDFNFFQQFLNQKENQHEKRKIEIRSKFVYSMLKIYFFPNILSPENSKRELTPPC